MEQKTRKLAQTKKSMEKTTFGECSKKHDVGHISSERRVVKIKRENYSLWFLPFCPFALMPFRPVALAPPLLSSSAKFGRLSNEGIFCSCFHISVHVQILSTLLMLLLPAQMTTMTFFSRRQFRLYLAANVEALSKHPKAWRRTRSRCRSSWDLRI